jgi:hypothetical protein
MSRNAEDNFTHMVNYCYYCHFSRPGIYIATLKRGGLAFSMGDERVEFSK